MISAAGESLDASDITGILLIDCWEPRADKAHKINPWHQEIVDFGRTLSLTCVVNAAYNCMLDYDIFGDGDHSHYHTMKLYNGVDSRYNNTSRGTGTDFDLSQHGNVVMQNILRYCTGMSKTSRIIKTLTKMPGSIFLLTPEDFEHHWLWHLNQQVNHWFVAGQTWQMCTHQRPLGLNSLPSISQRTGCEFYTAPWAMLDQNLDPITEQHFANDHLTWQPSGKLGYRLCWQ